MGEGQHLPQAQTLCNQTQSFDSRKKVFPQNSCSKELLSLCLSKVFHK